MTNNVRRFVLGCQKFYEECAMAKTSWQTSIQQTPPAACSMLPLVTPRSWLHHGPSLLVSFTYVHIVVVDSKACCLVPLKGIPTAMEMAVLLLNHVLYRNFGLLEDIVSIEFITRVWKAFLSLLGVTVKASPLVTTIRADGWADVEED